MQLEKIRIERMEYGPNKGRLEGEITFKSPVGRVQTLLNDTLCTKILYVVAENLVETTKQIADNMTAEIITQTPALIQK